MNRRKLLEWTVKGTGAVVVGTLVVPAAVDALTPVIKATHDPVWRPIGPVDQFALGEITAAEISMPDDLASYGVPKVGVYVWRKSEVEFVVFSRACTDLGCPVNYDKGSGWFFCPCHGGIFDSEGNRRAGPPKRPLWRYATRVSETGLEVDLRSVPPMV